MDKRKSCFILYFIQYQAFIMAVLYLFSFTMGTCTSFVNCVIAFCLFVLFFLNKCFTSVKKVIFCKKKLNHRISWNDTENHKYAKGFQCSVIIGCGFDTEYLYKKYSIIICYSYNYYYCSTPIYKAFFVSYIEFSLPIYCSSLSDKGIKCVM